MFCPMCGAPNEDSSVYCGNCGAALTADAPPPVVDEVRSETPADAVGDVVNQPVYAPPEPVYAPPEPAYAPVPVAPSIPVNGMAIASLILGIAGLTVLPLISSIFAIIFGYMARRDIRQRPSQTSGDGMAKAGIILGWIGVGLLVLGIVFGGATLLCGLCSAIGSSGY
jgi:Domain of unknown function (DUF4190)/zinc-ribbon domain